MKATVNENDEQYIVCLEAEDVADAAMLTRMALSSRQTEAVAVEATYWGKTVSGWVYVTRRKDKRARGIGGR